MPAARSDITVTTCDDGATLSVALQPRLDAVGPMHDAIAGFLARAGADASLVHRVMLATEELVVNAILHGRAGRSVTSLVLDIRHQPGRIATQISYDGDAFDPTAAPPRPGTADGRPGGLGLELVRNAADSFSYDRRGGRNIVSLSHTLPR